MGLVGYQLAYNFAVYHQDAVAIGDSFQTVVDGSLTPWLDPGKELARKIEQALWKKLGVPVLRGILSGGCGAVFNIVASDDNPCTLDLDRLGELVLSAVRTLIPQGQWRYLTAGEKNGAIEARLQIRNVHKVKVFNRPFKLFEETIAMAPDGNVYWIGADGSLPWSEDFSTGSPVAFQVLIHELMHVYQCRTWGWSSVVIVWKAALANEDYYYCPLVPGRTISGYNMEEQAELVSDRFALSRGGSVYRAKNLTCGTLPNLDPIVRF